MKTKREFVNDIKIEHFLPSFWKANYQEKSSVNWARRVAKDPDLDEYYLDEPKYVLREKCFFLALAVQICYTILTIANIILCAIKSLYYLVIGIINHDKEILFKIPSEIGKLLLAPFILVFAEAIVIMGLFIPLDARKIFASIERFLVLNYEAAGFLQRMKYANMEHSFIEEYSYSPSDYKEFIDEYYELSNNVYSRNNEEIACSEQEQKKYKTMEDNIEKKKTQLAGYVDHIKTILYYKKNLSIFAACFQPKRLITHEKSNKNYNNQEETHQPLCTATPHVMLK